MDLEYIFNQKSAYEVTERIVQHWLKNQNSTYLSDFKEYENLSKSLQNLVKTCLFCKKIDISENGKLHSMYGGLVEYF